MPRSKRVNNSSLPVRKIKTGQHKRGISQPVAQVVEMNTPRPRKFQILSINPAPITPEVVDALADVMLAIGVA